jgi:hypothetical protein
LRVAVIGSRDIYIKNLSDYLPLNTSVIISGGAIGVDSCAKKYAFDHNIPYKEFRPNYKLFGRSAPIRRNIEIVENSDIIIAFWNMRSRGTKYTIDYARKRDKQTIVIKVKLSSDQISLF